MNKDKTITLNAQMVISKTESGEEAGAETAA